ncbi:DNA oxidative demethylase ALKBH2-like isoform X1 [Bacillus rossius redtenbacheri]|uniref:DNA oxidative demethylase ALKBH2-like isoform X1 n=1 Tax=Bacillus rossius redtenbacheri TaxID=93214 RepID=UPI002FDE9B5A
MTMEEKVLKWQKFSEEGLDLDYAVLLPRDAASHLLQQLERVVTYLPPEVARVRVFGRWHPIPRQQVILISHVYRSSTTPSHSLLCTVHIHMFRFSGNTIFAGEWPCVVRELRDHLYKVTGEFYNFVLVNRYRNGDDHMGEHRDDESELDPSAPIASVSLGQSRQFVLRHKDARKKGPDRRNISPVKITLEHGSLLMMNPPTNQYWYHSLPRRKNCPGVRVNLTFRRIIKNP